MVCQQWRRLFWSSLTWLQDPHWGQAVFSISVASSLASRPLCSLPSKHQPGPSFQDVMLPPGSQTVLPKACTIWRLPTSWTTPFHLLHMQANHAGFLSVSQSRHAPSCPWASAHAILPCVECLLFLLLPAFHLARAPLPFLSSSPLRGSQTFQDSFVPLPAAIPYHHYPTLTSLCPRPSLYHPALWCLLPFHLQRQAVSPSQGGLCSILVTSPTPGTGPCP